MTFIRYLYCTYLAVYSLLYNKYIVFQKANGQGKCNLMVILSQNHTLWNSMESADAFFFASKAPFKLVTMANDFKERVKPKKAYDYHVVTDTGVQRYIANTDIRWRELKAAYTLVYPYLARSKEGKWSGLDWDIWNIICHSLGLKLNMLEKHSTFASAYKSLTNMSVDLKLPQSPFSYSLLEVTFHW